MSKKTQLTELKRLRQEISDSIENGKAFSPARWAFDIYVAAKTLEPHSDKNEQKDDRYEDLIIHQDKARELYFEELERIRNLNLDYEHLLSYAAARSLNANFFEYQNNDNLAALSDALVAISVFSAKPDDIPSEQINNFLSELSKIENVFSERLLSGIGSQKHVQAKTAGKNGASKRHQPMDELKQYAIALYKRKKWNSANEAAFELQQQIINHGKTINANLKPSNAQRTIAEWFRKSV